MCPCNYSRLNWPLANSRRAGSWARSVIPFSFFPAVIVASYNSPETLRVTVTWFAIVPHLIISLHRAAIKPIKFVTSFPIQPNPPIAGAGSVPQQVINKLVFILWRGLVPKFDKICVNRSMLRQKIYYQHNSTILRVSRSLLDKCLLRGNTVL